MAASSDTKLVFTAGFQTIYSEAFRKSSLAEGKTILEHIFNVEEIHCNSEIIIRGKCLPTTRINSPPYLVEFNVTIDRIVSSGHCSCVAGMDGTCKHGASLFLFINQERSESVTDSQQKWKGPSSKARALYPKGSSIKSMLGDLSGNERFSVYEKDLDKRTLCDEFEKFGLQSSSMAKSLRVEREMVTADVEMELEENIEEDIRSLFLSPRPESSEFIIRPETSAFYDANIVRSADDCFDIFNRTKGQAENPDWFRERKFRISASNALRIANARKEETTKSYFFGRSIECKNLNYGRAMEVPAKAKFAEKNKDVELIDCGVVIHPTLNWLCASPDALIRSTDGLSVLEVKCPISCENQMISVPYLRDGALLKSHMYYSQIQIQLYVCGLYKAILFVYSEKDDVCIEVLRDDEFL